MNYHLTLRSYNEKTGPIPVSTSGKQSCPPKCRLKGSGCYAESGNLAIHWRKVTDGSRGTDLATFCKSIASLPAGQLWRHNQAGDLPGLNDTIDARALGSIVSANQGKRGFTYTHYPLTRENRACIRGANKAGFTVNISTDSLAQADRAKSALCGPVVVVVHESAPETLTTPAGNRVIVCPVQTGKTASCETCKLCAWSGRDVIIGFRAHGSRRKLVSELVSIS